MRTPKPTRQELEQRLAALEREAACHLHVEDELRLHGEIMANMAEGVYLVRAEDGIIVYANPKFEAMFGYEPGEMLGRPVSIVNAPTDQSPEETAAKIMAALAAQGSWQGEVHNIRKDGSTFWCRASVNVFDHYRYGQVYISAHTDITAAKQADLALRKNELRHRTILSRSIDGFFTCDPQGRLLDANDSFCRMLGYSLEELHRLSIPDIEANESPEEVARHIERVIHEGHDRFESRHRHRDGHLIAVELSVNFDPTLGEAFFAFVRDISERKRTEAALLESEEKYRLIAESSTESIFQLDPAGTFTFINIAGAEMADSRPEEILGHTFFSLLAEESHAEGATYFQRALAGDPVHGELLARSKNGTIFPISFSAAPQQKDGRVVGITGIARDITDRRREEKERLRQSLQEKESLLKEIHHRVKNNMQIISSLLSLQSQNSDNAMVREAIRDSRNRVKTMGLIHEKLYQSGNLSNIDFRDYLRTLTRDIISTYAFPAARRVRCTVNGEAIALTADTAIPCGLIVTELVTNSLKYAFTHGQGGEITIDISRTADQRVSLSVRDNGGGLPPDFDAGPTHTLGMSLVQTLARQLGATLELHNDHGVRCDLLFEAEPPPPGPRSSRSAPDAGAPT